MFKYVDLSMTIRSYPSSHGMRIEPEIMQNISHSSDLLSLIEQMSRGDRDATAALVDRHRETVLRAIRLKMSSRMRQVYDSVDVFSSVSRRLDRSVRNGDVCFKTEHALVAYLKRAAEHVVINKASVARRLERVERGDERIMAELRRSVGPEYAEQADDAIDAWIRSVLGLLDDREDRFIVCSWIAQRPHAVTAELLDIKPQAVRKKWERIRRHLADRLSSSEHRELLAR